MKRFIKLLTLTCLLLTGAVAVAVPLSFNYQGSIKDSGGVPLDGSGYFKFAFIDSTGTVAYWANDDATLDGREPTTAVTIPVSNGRFNVKIGDTALTNMAALTEDLFENEPLFMRVWFSYDGVNFELFAPDAKVLSNAFAIKAGNADTLGGNNPDVYDQSMHVTNTANPHSVTAAQVGAATSAELSAHTADISNPHNVTATQTGAVSSADLSAHTGNTSNPHNVTATQIGAASSAEIIANINSHTANTAAHHPRYTDAEAVNAMGANSNANALNHDRYTDTNVVAAMLAADGAGSTLDADRVDGLEASEIILAASDEVRTPINSLPFTITQPGSYYLTGNLDGSTGGIDINAANVMIDLMGFTIDGGNGADYGIFSNTATYDNITIKNGYIQNFGYSGIFLGGSVGTHYHKILYVSILANGQSGVIMPGHNNFIQNCTVADNGGDGISAGISATIMRNNVYNNNLNSSSSGPYAIRGGFGSLISNNTVYSNNNNYAIYGDGGSIITGNLAYFNRGTYGIYGSNGATIDGNTVYLQQLGGFIDLGYAIYVNSSSTVTGNAVYYNLHWGIYINGQGNLIKANTVKNNNNSNSATEGGMYIGSGNRVVDNVLNYNNINNIYVGGADNILRENHLIGSGNGILFNASGNYYRENTASGHTINFNLNGFAQADGGGNTNF